MQKKTWFTLVRLRSIVGGILCITLFGGILYTVLYKFDVRQIEFESDGMEITVNERLITGNVLFFPADKVRQDLLREYPQLKDVLIQKKFPHTILIKPMLRKPYARLTTTKATYGIDEEGKVIAIGTTETRLPDIRIDLPIVRVGTKVTDGNVMKALEFLQQSKSFLTVTTVQTTEDGMSLKAISDKTEILFTQNQSIETVMATLQTIITGVRIKGTMPKVIDVRFSKPVVQW
jgi:cell division septal protein FtsQ